MGNFCEAFSWFSPNREIPFANAPELIKNLSKSLCKVQSLNGNIYSDIFSGFLIKLPKKGQSIFCLITCKDFITEEMINKNESIIFHYDNDKRKATINLNKNERYIEYITENNLDLLIIEILPKDSVEQSFFLLPSMNNNYEELNNKEITVVSNLGFSYGKIEKINEENFIYKINNNLNNGKLRARIPIFLKDNNEVIGISKEDKKIYNDNVADFLKFIFIKLNQNQNKEKEEEKKVIIEAKEKEETKEEKTEKRIELEDGGYYIGELINDEIPNGKGKYFFKNGETYEGSIKEDKFEGNGKYIYENSEYYIGEWKDDLRNGKGILYYKNGNIKYEGDFINDKYEGNGKYIWENGDYYEGEYKNGFNNGKGILYYNNGKIEYEGEFLNDKFEGNGKYIYDDEQYYIGQFKNGLKDGKGTLYYKNGNIEYEGDFKEGKFDGEGKYIYANGDYYIGQFKEGLCHGKGKEYDKNGNIISEGELNYDNKI